MTVHFAAMLLIGAGIGSVGVMSFFLVFSKIDKRRAAKRYQETRTQDYIAELENVRYDIDATHPFSDLYGAIANRTEDQNASDHEMKVLITLLTRQEQITKDALESYGVLREALGEVTNELAELRAEFDAQ